MTERIERAIADLEKRKATCWAMAEVFLKNRDAHGIHDMGVEIQALDRGIAELKAIAGWTDGSHRSLVA
jgi:hypothetical protein